MICGKVEGVGWPRHYEPTKLQPKLPSRTNPHWEEIAGIMPKMIITGTIEIKEEDWYKSEGGGPRQKNSESRLLFEDHTVTWEWALGC